MTVTTAALLEVGMGTALPTSIRQTLIDIGVSCNAAVLALNYAEIELQQAQAARAELHSGPTRFPWQARGIDDRVTCADAHRDHLAVVLARSATPYAAYVAQVAVEVAAGRTPALPESAMPLPSQLINDPARFLPVIRFPGESEALQDQNADVDAARQALLAVIDDDRRTGAATRYDDVRVGQRPSHDAVGELTLFPEALLAYASTLTWALGVFTKR